MAVRFGAADNAADGSGHRVELTPDELLASLGPVPCSPDDALWGLQVLSTAYGVPLGLWRAEDEVPSRGGSVFADAFSEAARWRASLSRRSPLTAATYVREVVPKLPRGGPDDPESFIAVISEDARDEDLFFILTGLTGRLASSSEAAWGRFGLVTAIADDVVGAFLADLGRALQYPSALLRPQDWVDDGALSFAYARARRQLLHRGVAPYREGCEPGAWPYAEPRYKDIELRPTRGMEAFLAQGVDFPEQLSPIIETLARELEAYRTGRPPYRPWWIRLFWGP